MYCLLAMITIQQIYSNALTQHEADNIWPLVCANCVTHHRNEKMALFLLVSLLPSFHLPVHPLDTPHLLLEDPRRGDLEAHLSDWRQVDISTCLEM